MSRACDAIRVDRTGQRPSNLLNQLQGHPFDVVLLRTVLFYAALESKKQSMDNVRSVARVGGLLVSCLAGRIADRFRYEMCLLP